MFRVGQVYVFRGFDDGITFFVREVTGRILDDTYDVVGVKTYFFRNVLGADKILGSVLSPFYVLGMQASHASYAANY